MMFAFIILQKNNFLKTGRENPAGDHNVDF